ncbi:Gamma-aminobutyric acid type B receptor subunit 2 [Desmophyllum pertusum]|uniref:Gamma-aminobutyric acid type B receptor subunit 2 n=1 Tax=Desmophyllum pertusum TaxID=174260 RepID=A0A9W9Z5I8_9CNID|nr:Gamma-aminobutyric acid type B receptor subunit 2 [Desmophyllum pertusum]
MWEQVSTRSRKSFWMSLKLFSYLCAIHATTQGLANNQRKVLTIGGLYASGAMTTWQNGSGIVKTVNEAIRFINERSQLLPGYKLEIEWRDTKCQLGHGVQALFKHVNEPPTKIMLLGGMCSAATRPIAECSHLMNLIQVSYGASSFYLSDKEKYPLFFRTIPPEKGHNAGRLAVLKYFKWNRIAIVTEREPYYEAAFTSLTKLLKENDITIVADEFLGESKEEEHESPIKILKDRDARVIVGLFSEEKAVEVFCQAYKQGLYGEKYVWLLIGWYRPRWWEIHSARASKLDCKTEHVTEAFGNYISTEFLKIGPSSPDIIGGEKAYLTWKNKVDELGFYSGFAHDAIVAMTLALNSSAEVLARRNQSLADFTYNNTEMAQLFKNSLSKVTFPGFSGRVYFNKQGERKGVVTVSQMQDKETKILGNYTVLKDKLVLKSSKFVWKGGNIPVDQMTTVDKLLKISPGLFGFFCAVEVLGIIMAVAFLAFNICHSDHRFIKMSSPRINNVIVVGAILIYIAGILLGIDGNFVSPDVEAIVRCRFSTWVACLGFTLGFGGMFLKTWRVHKIFLNRTKKMVISDFQLFAMLGLFISIDLLILMVWEIVDPLYITKHYTGREEYSPSTDTKYKPYYIDCTSSYTSLWLGVIYAYKGLMLAFGAFMAWETRNVTFSALNDSRYIGISVYNVVFPCALGMTVVNVVINRDACFAVLSVLVVFCTTITLCLVFVPKISTVRADPLGTNRPRFAAAAALNNQTPQTRPEERQQLRTEPNRELNPSTRPKQEDRQRANTNLI